MSRIFHISMARLSFIQHLGFALSIDGGPAETYREGNVNFHVLLEEYGFCHDCQNWFWSADANSPAELETIKVALSLGRTEALIARILSEGRQQLVQMFHDQMMSKNWTEI